MSLLFLPSSSLNFTNILSTWDISPRQYYSLRGFGFRRSFPVDLNPYDEVLLAFNFIPIFDVVESDLNEFPVVIQFDASDFGLTVVETNPYKIYYSHSSVRFSLKNTKFIVRDTNQKRILLSMLKSSLEVKRENFVSDMILSLDEVPDSLKLNFGKDNLQKLSFSFVQCDIDLFSEKYLNKVRGFLHGYALGKLYEGSGALAILRNQFREFENIQSFILNLITQGGKKSSVSDSLSAERIHKEMFGLRRLADELISGFYVLERDFLIDFVKKDYNLSFDETSILLKKSNSRMGKEMLYSLFNDSYSDFGSKFNNYYLSADVIRKIYTCIEDAVSRKPSAKELDLLNTEIRSMVTLVHSRLEKLAGFDLSKIDISFSSLVFDSSFHLSDMQLSDHSLDTSRAYLIVINELIDSLDIARREELGISRLELVSKIGKSLKKGGFDDKYLDVLRDIYYSVKSVGQGIRIDDIEDPVLFSLGCLCRYYNSEENFIKAVERHSSMPFSFAFGIWGAAIGYAGLSKVFLGHLDDRSQVCESIDEYLVSFKNYYPNDWVLAQSFDVKSEAIKVGDTIEFDRWPGIAGDGVSDAFSEFKSKFSPNDYLDSIDTSFIGEIKTVIVDVFELILSPDYKCKNVDEFVSLFESLLSKKLPRKVKDKKAKTSKLVEQLKLFITNF